MPLNKTGVIGFPIGHSLSPVIHSYWYEKLGLNGSYEAIEMSPEQLDNFFHQVEHNEFIGLNVTVPHKQAVLKYADYLDETAKNIGAINTLSFANNEIRATNTDAYGLVENVKSSVGDISPYLEQVMILGAGGAARAAIVGLLDVGAKRITLTNRTKIRAESLINEFGENLDIVDWKEKDAALQNVTMLVNTTSLGMEKMPPLEMSLQALPKTALVYDIVYKPLQTDLLKQAIARGNKTVTGIGMLIYQAQKAFAFWHGVLPEIDDALLQKIMATLENKS